MSMDELVLAKLVELARNPTTEQLRDAKAQLESLNVLCTRLQKDADRLRTRERLVDGPLTELWQAAEALLKATPKTKRPAHELAAYERLHAALKTASPFVDQIPF
jgi:hypothetical protein